MKIAIFHPQIDVLAGGEMLAMKIANTLSKNNEVYILSSIKVDKVKIRNFFNLNTKNINFKVRFFDKLIDLLPSLSSYKLSLKLGYLGDMNSYDLVIDTGTNGWFSKKIMPKTLCYVHFPYFQPVKSGWKKFTNLLLIKPESAFQYDKILCNSYFTKEILKNLTKKDVEVVYPPVETSKMKPKLKENIITTIGRFTYEKKHEIMIKAFKKLNLKDWKFHLIGSFQEKTSLYKESYLEKLKKMANGNKIFLHINLPREEVIDFLGKTRIYWHARGYGEKDPNESENFGVTTVESMAAGCVPVVINLGAQPEIVEHGKNGFVWNEPEELVKYTIDLINDKEKMNKLSTEAIKKSKQYGSKIFENKLLKIIEEMFSRKK